MTQTQGLYIDEDTGLSNDYGPFRSYRLVTEGGSLEELIENARIYEIDQYGGDHDGEGVEDYGEELNEVCVIMIKKRWEEHLKPRPA